MKYFIVELVKGRVRKLVLVAEDEVDGFVAKANKAKNKFYILKSFYYY